MVSLSRLKRAVIGIIQNSTEKVPVITDQLAKEVIGQSVEKRDIVVYKIGCGKKKVLFLAGMHGNEVGTVKLALHLTDFLHREHSKQKSLTFYILPVLNPDGYALALKNPDYFNFGRIGRFNARGVDLNRNFAAKSWQISADWTHG